MNEETETGELAPGQSRSWPRLNARTRSNIYLVGAVPSQPVSGTCQITMTATYRTQSSRQTDFIYTATNTGDIACSAKLRHVALRVDSTTPSDPLTPPPGERILLWTRMPADSKVIVPGAAPFTTAAGECQYDIGTMYYTEPPPHNHGVRIAYHNTGTVTCAIAGTFAVLR